MIKIPTTKKERQEFLNSLTQTEIMTLIYQQSKEFNSREKFIAHFSSLFTKNELIIMYEKLHNGLRPRASMSKVDIIYSLKEYLSSMSRSISLSRSIKSLPLQGPTYWELD